MNITNQDLRAAVSAGMISEAQAASLTNLAQVRLGAIQTTAEVDEPFELFKGFNEIFIVVGLSILYLGWMGVTGFSLMASTGQEGGTVVAFGAFTMFIVALLAKYFTLKRRMIAPSILLAIFMVFAGIQVGFGLAALADLATSTTAITVSGVVFVSQLVFWALFRVPFSMLILGASAFAQVVFIFIVGGSELQDPERLFLLTAQGPFGLITIIMGLLGFALAMRFDMSDPHRVTRRSANGFWLHVIAAPAIVNTVALTLFAMETAAAYAVLFAFLVLMALVALIINRRSFLIAGVGYVVALAATLFEDAGGVGFAVLALGLVLVMLGAGWEKFRARIMEALPSFRGKDRLPPWGLLTGDSE